MFAAVFYNGRNAAAIDVQCDVADNMALHIRGQGVEQRVELARIRVSPRLARTRRILFLPDGAQIHSDDNDAVDAMFPGRNRLETWVDRLERHWRAVVASALTSAVAGVLFFAFGLPWLADRIAQKIPFAVEQAMGEQALSLLRRVALNPSALPAERQQALRVRFNEFVRDIPDGPQYRLEFFAAPGIGANAFALPGGTIVFTDEMLPVLDGDDEFLAVAAHEIGHEQRRHLLRLVLRDSAVVVIGTLFAGDVSSASTLVVAIPTFLLQNHYTRGFEADADDYAFAALAAHKISPQVFAEVMRKFERKYPQLKDATMAYASTHPPTEERIRRAEQAAKSYSAH
jgi:Zn-dependent protease with chaperone function